MVEHVTRWSASSRRTAADDPTERTTAEPPVRGADRNRSLVDRADPGSDGHLLPSLEAGITLLDVEGDRGVPIVQSLVLDHLLLQEGPALWVDANGYATTATMARLAPSRRLLDRIRVVRGFTACQHYAAVRDFGGTTDHSASRCGTESSPTAPSLVVAPAVDARYREDDAVDDEQGGRLLARTLARLAAIGRGDDSSPFRTAVPVLVTRTAAEAVGEAVEAAAHRHLRCEQTPMGPRFVGDDFETLVYPLGDGTTQTTFAYWRRLLGARAKQVGAGSDPPSSSPGSRSPSSTTGSRSPSSTTGSRSPSSTTGHTPDGGAAVTAVGESGAHSADPLLDAWTEGW